MASGHMSKHTLQTTDNGKLSLCHLCIHKLDLLVKTNYYCTTVLVSDLLLSYAAPVLYNALLVYMRVKLDALREGCWLSEVSYSQQLAKATTL